MNTQRPQNLNWTQWMGGDVAPRRLTQSIALEESPVPGILRTGVTILGALMLVFAVWSSIAEIEEVASAPGQIVPSGYIQNIQHLEGGIVREILIHEGDLVQAGQPLVKLDATSAESDLGQMKARQMSLQLQAERLKSFADNTDISPEALSPEERAILSSMIDARNNQQNVLRDQLSQKQKELQGIIANREALQKNVALMEKEYQITKEMSAKGSTSKLDAMTSERELNAMKGQYGAIQNQEKQARDAIREFENRLSSLASDLRQDAMKNLGQVQAQLAETNNAITKLESAASRTTLTAPVSGIIKGLSVHTIGAVVEPGKVLMEVVPIGGDLIVESLVSPADVGNLKVGQPVKVKVSAFDSSRYGSAPGKLQSVSASTFQNEQGQTFYRVKISLDHNYVGNDPSRNLVLPGMTVQAEIITGQKTVLDYLLRPLHMVTQSAFRER